MEAIDTAPWPLETSRAGASLPGVAAVGSVRAAELRNMMLAAAVNTIHDFTLYIFKFHIIATAYHHDIR